MVVHNDIHLYKKLKERTKKLKSHRRYKVSYQAINLLLNFHFAWKNDLLSSYFKNCIGTSDVAQLVVCLPGMHNALHWSSSTR